MSYVCLKITSELFTVSLTASYSRLMKGLSTRDCVKEDDVFSVWARKALHALRHTLKETLHI